MLLERFDNAKKFNLGDVPVGEIVLVKFDETRNHNEPDIMVYAAIVTHQFKTKTRIESIGYDDADTGSDPLSLAKTFQCVWLTETTNPISRL